MSTPDPHRIAQHGRSVANLIADHGKDALKMASVLASVGYPASTLGDGGSRGSDGTSSTERAAIALMSDRWRLVDSRYAALLDLWHLTGLQLAALTTDIMAHAEAEGLRPMPSGAGECPACRHYCSGTANDRLKSGFCDTDLKAWVRAGRPPRTEWTTERRKALASPDEEGAA